MEHKSIRVLLVEDNPGDTRMLRELLAEAPSPRFELTHVDRLGQALRRLGKEYFDVVLLDLSLPDAEGLDTFVLMHAQAPRVPIVVLTGFDDEAIAIQVVRGGAQDYLVKGEIVAGGGNLLARSIRYAIERKRMEEVLRESERTFRSFVEQSSDAIVLTDERGNIIEWNPGAERITGLTWTEVLGRPLWDVQFQLVPDERRTPATYERIKNSLTELFETGQGWWLNQLQEVEILRSDGTRRAVQTSGFILQTDRGFKAGAIIRDTTERKRTEEALRESEEQYRLLTETARDIIAVHDMDGRFTYINKAGQEISGYSEKELLDLRVTDVIATEHLAAVTDRHEKRADGDRGTFLYETEFINKAGQRVPIEVSSSPLVQQDCPVGVLIVARDITERMQVEKAYRTLVEKSLQGIMVFRHHRILFANQMAAEIIGYTVEELLAMSPEKVNALTHPEDRARIVGYHRDRMAGKPAPLRYEQRVIRKDGAVRWLQAAASRIEYRGQPAVEIFYVDVTERKQTEEALRESEEQYRLLAETARDIIFVNDVDGRFTYINQAGQEISGYSEEEILSMSVFDLLPAEHLAAAGDRRAKRAAGDRGTFLYETEFINKAGRCIPIEVSSSPLIQHGQVSGTLAVARDISERVQAQEVQRRRAAELGALQATVLDITAHHDLPTLLQTIVERAARLLNAQSGGMYLCDPDQKLVRCVVSYNTPRDYRGIVLKYGEGASGTVAHTGEPLIIDDYRTWSGRAAVYEEEQPFRAVLAAPMIWQGQVTGAINVLRAEGERFAQADLDLLTLFANHAAIALENTRLYVQAQDELKERKKAQELLQESQERYRLLFELGSDAIVLVDVETLQHVDVNQAALKLYGYSREQFLALKSPDVSAEPEKTQATIRTAGSREIIPLRYHRKKDGTVFPVEIYARFFDLQGRKMMLAAIRDVAERIEAEEALRASEENYRLVGENIPVAVYSALPDEHSTNLFISGRIKELTGYSDERFLDDPELWANVLHPDDADYVWEKIQEHRQKKIPLDVEYRIVTQDKMVKWVRDRATPMLDDEGQILRIDGFMEDITKRKRAEDALRDAFERHKELEGIVNRSPAVVFLWRAAEGWPVEFVSDNVQQFEYSPEDFYAGHIPYADIVHPDDLERVVAEVARYSQEKGRESFEQEYRIITASGEVRWLDDRTWIRRDADGVITHYQGIVLDITERVRAGEALKESEERSRTVVSSAPVVLWAVDSDGLFTVSEGKGLEAIGLKPGEVVGQSVFDVYRDHPDIVRDVKRTLAGEAFTTLHQVDDVVFESRFTPLKDQHNQVAGVIGVSVDITERVRADEALQESEVRYRSLFEESPLPLWEEDFSAVKAYLDDLRETGVTDLRAYLTENPKAAVECSRLVRVLNVNQAAVEYHEASCKEELLAGLDGIFTDESLPVFQEELIALAEGSTRFQSEISSQTLAGERISAIVRVSIPPGYEDTWTRVYVSSVSITDLKRAQERNATILRTSLDGFWVVDVEGKILEVNDAYCRMLGYGRDDLLSMRLEDVETFDSPQDIARRMQQIKRAGSRRFETRHRRKDGTAIDLEVSANYMPLDGGRVFTFFRDITERVRAEEQIRAALREKEVLLKEIHHRVKNNLQVISSLLELQSNSVEDLQVRQAFQDSRSRIRAMGLIHERLYKSQDLTGIVAAGYIQDLVERLFNIYGRPSGAITLNSQIDDVTLGIDTAIPCGLIINELVSNALKHAFPPGRDAGGEIRVALSVVDEDRLSLLVGDDGVGFPPDLDLENSPSLGLQLVNLLTRQLGGTLELDTSTGTTFKITFAGQ